MSLIEKAMDRLGRSPSVAPSPLQRIEPQGPHVESAPAPVRVERIAERPEPHEPDARIATVLRANVDFNRLHRLGMLTPDAERSAISEEFRLIKRPLLANAFGAAAVPRGNVIMVTSALPKEGKTFCAVNLAISAAMERDRTVLLVDADVAKPSVPGVLGIECDRGLQDLLLDPHLGVPEVLIQTNIDTLRFLPAGRRSRHSTELLASDRMSALIDEAARRYPDRLIIVDSPPLLSTTEACVLAEHVGQVVMVVEEQGTPRESINEALARIEGCEHIGFVLNKSRASSSTGYYDYDENNK